MELNRRNFSAGLAAASLCRPTWAVADDDKGLFWNVSRNGQQLAILFGYERTAATITADVVKDGDRFVDGAQRLVGAMPNFKMPPVDITKTGVPPLVSRLSPPSAQRVRDFVAANPALRSSIDNFSGITLVTIMMLEGQTPAPITVGGTIAEHAQAANKLIFYLLSLDDIKGIYRPPDLGAIDRGIDDGIVTYLMNLRDSVGPLGKYMETLYVTRRSQELRRFADEMTTRGVPRIEAATGLPPDKLQSLLSIRARDLLNQQAPGIAFLMLPLGTLMGSTSLLEMLRQALAWMSARRRECRAGLRRTSRPLSFEHQSSRTGSSQNLRHRVTGAGPEFACRRSTLNVAVSQIEAPSGLRAYQGTSRVASFRGPRFESPEQGTTDAAKPRIRRNVIEGDLAGLGDRAHRKDVVTLGGDQQRIVRPPDPGRENLRGLVGQPSRQDGFVVPMIGDTQFRDRPPHHPAGGWCVFSGGGTNFHAIICNQDASAATLVMMDRTPNMSDDRVGAAPGR
jgi:hypothetical protein